MLENGRCTMVHEEEVMREVQDRVEGPIDRASLHGLLIPRRRSGRRRRDDLAPPNPLILSSDKGRSERTPEEGTEDPWKSCKPQLSDDVLFRPVNPAGIVFKHPPGL